MRPFLGAPWPGSIIIILCTTAPAQLSVPGRMATEALHHINPVHWRGPDLTNFFCSPFAPPVICSVPFASDIGTVDCVASPAVAFCFVALNHRDIDIPGATICSVCSCECSAWNNLRFICLQPCVHHCVVLKCWCGALTVMLELQKLRAMANREVKAECVRVDGLGRVGGGARAHRPRCETWASGKPQRSAPTCPLPSSSALSLTLQ